MQFKFKRHQLVKLLKDPNPEYIEYHPEDEESLIEVPIKKGMLAKINIILSNGEYHVAILDQNNKDKVIAYALLHEEELESVI